MRVIAGTARGKNLQALPGEDVTRPTINRVKEAMFSSVQFLVPGARVLDLFAGSGSTCVAALQSGRRYIGIELLEQYHRAGQQRLAAVQRAMQQGAANDDWFMPEAA